MVERNFNFPGTSLFLQQHICYLQPVPKYAVQYLTFLIAGSVSFLAKKAEKDYSQTHVSLH